MHMLLIYFFCVNDELNFSKKATITIAVIENIYHKKYIQLIESYLLI